MHYRGGAPVLWRSPDTIQVGSSRGTVVCGLSAREQRFLSSLPEFISPESVRADARAAGRPVGGGPGCGVLCLWAGGAPTTPGGGAPPFASAAPGLR